MLPYRKTKKKTRDVPLAGASLGFYSNEFVPWIDITVPKDSTTLFRVQRHYGIMPLCHYAIVAAPALEISFSRRRTYQASLHSHPELRPSRQPI